MLKKLLKLSSLSVLMILGCNDSQKTTIEFMPDMSNQPSVKAQEEGGMRLPPENTQPISYSAYPYSKEEVAQSDSIKNPIEISSAVIARGKNAFNTFCAVCHGPKGDGNGSITQARVDAKGNPLPPPYPRPPAVTSDKVRGLTDGHIFHIITRGQNLMPSYSTQILPEDRWAIIWYVRALQRATKPSAEDVEALKKALTNKTFP